MEFNILDKNNKFKLGNIITTFNLPNNDKEFILFTVGDYDGTEDNLCVAYLNRNSEEYDYIESIEDERVLKDAMEAGKDILKKIIDKE